MTRTHEPHARADLRRLLDGQSWGGSTPALALLGFTVTVHVTDPDLATFVSRLYTPMNTTATAQHTLSLSESTAGRFFVHLDGIRRVATRSPAVAFARLLWEANRQAIEHTADRVLLHAAAAASDGRGVVLTGPMGAGKSTLVAALVRDGFEYLTDEVVAIQPGTTTVDPYPKPIALGGFGLAIPTALNPIHPELPTGMDRYVGDRWLVAPEAIAEPTSIDVVVVPRYEPGAMPSLEPLRPADALVALAEHAFNLATDGQRALDTLAMVAETAACFRLVSADPDAASALISTAIAT